ncbi:MAG: hypothetical protein LBQ50_14865 [Planctomycetaceae bacterium]|jgi:hypothetical protein|nr:hypothetical protein [Planctomycetaceae bacterium]
MNNEIKRRIFLSGIVGSLIGLPVTVRLLTGKSEKNEMIQSHHFTKELEKYRSLVDVPITSTNGTQSFFLTPAPPIGKEWRYIFYSPSFLPEEVSHATGKDPDTFFVREGILYVDQMNNGQVVITGGDSLCRVISPSWEEKKNTKSVMILVKNGQLHLTKPKGTILPTNIDVQLLHLLTLGIPNQELKVGMKWRGNTGRIKPFTGYSTQYEILGFANVDGHQTVNVSFSGDIPNIVKSNGIVETKFENETVLSNRHHGNCYFDLENGCLVRQEVEIESFNAGIKGYKGKGGLDSITIKAQFIVQLYTT